MLTQKNFPGIVIGSEKVVIGQLYTIVCLCHFPVVCLSMSVPVGQCLIGKQMGSG